MTVLNRRLLSTSLAFAAMAITFAAAAPQANAQQYKVTVDTSGLISSDVWAADFVLTNGGSTSSPSTVSISDFLFGSTPATSGAALGTNPANTLNGDESGSLSTGVTLSTTSTSLISEYAEDFSPGDSLSFTIDASDLKAPDSGTLTADQFSFDLFDDSPSDTSYFNQNVLTSGGGYQLVTLSSPANGTYSAGSSDYIGFLNGQQYSVTISEIAAAPEISSVSAISLFFGLLAASMIPALRARLSKQD